MNLENTNRELEEKLREAASLGDMDFMKKLVKMDVNINSQNSMNGRTALHWGAKRGHLAVVQYLLANGADPRITDNEGKFPAELTANPDVHLLLGGSRDIAPAPSTLPITPSYLAHPPFPYSGNSERAQSGSSTSLDKERVYYETFRMNNHITSSPDDELVLKARLANSDDHDFIEVELPRTNLKYEALLNLLCAELCVDKQLVSRIRKLPDTIIRKDKDIGRLQDFQEVELVLTNKALSAASRGYGGIGAKPGMTNEQILY
ncbi:ankyrin repeat domain-containing protein 40-like isoform X2 [Pomacea canaliculata]|uniref:ankyrin repeat domain-containing protein 40-like isoform X2 n=1 Tax=Pomacea canaliculata TaxID=400727 RepID=UPI000D727A08|nr:ankyrin repeat domain-containing protein 40-like isoform X2 [Pomacea canaliculata]